MPYVTILSPKAGDTRQPPVVVQSMYSFSAAARIKSCVGTFCDAVGAPHGPGGGLHNSAGINAPGSAAGIVYTVTAESMPSGQGFSSEPNVTVKTTQPPIGGGGTSMVRRALLRSIWDAIVGLILGLFGYKKFHFGGTVDKALNPTAVVLVAFQLDGLTGTFVPVATKLLIPNAAAETWGGDLWLPCVPGRVFVVRALVFDDQANQTGSTTEVSVC